MHGLVHVYDCEKSPTAAWKDIPLLDHLKKKKQRVLGLIMWQLHQSTKNTKKCFPCGLQPYIPLKKTKKNMDIQVLHCTDEITG